jgi:hypothetical protein
MDRPFHLIDVYRHGGVFSVQLRQAVVDDQELEELGAEMARLLDEEGCRKLVLVLGPEEPRCLYSVFLAKLLNLKKRLEKVGGALAMAQVHPEAYRIFRVMGLEKFFAFYTSTAEAIAALGG